MKGAVDDAGMPPMARLQKGARVSALLPRGDGWVRLVSLLAFLALWQLVAWLLNSSSLPEPAVVFARVVDETRSLVLPFHLGITLSRVAVSFLLALAIGTAIGIAMGRWRRLDLLLDGWLVLGLNIPALVTIILCYVWFGLNDTAAIVAVAINKIPTVVVMVREGARAIDRGLMQVAQAYRLQRWRTFTQD
jgi:NitT/TauT family transport system permease protein